MLLNANLYSFKHKLHKSSKLKLEVAKQPGANTPCTTTWCTPTASTMT